MALAIAVLPSLYAWLNIYSNWDPYGNTGNISIAVASLDKGWTEEDGTQVNKGREVVEDLRSSTSINWVIVDTKEEAERGVYAGDYYAAVVINEDFSYNMYHMLTEWTGKPTITYYENYKKKARGYQDHRHGGVVPENHHQQKLSGRGGGRRFPGEPTTCRTS